MSNLTDLLPSGAGGKQVSFTASGTISTGATVILNSDGTVTAAGNDTGTQGKGSASIFETGVTRVDSIDAVYDTYNNKVVVVYCDESDGDKAKAVVGTVSGTSISFGTPGNVSTTTTTYVAACFDSSVNKVIVVYNDQANTAGKAAAGTVSGTDITFGSEYQFDSDITNFVDIVYSTDESKFVVFYSDSGNSNYGTRATGTCDSSSVITWETAVVFRSSATEWIAACEQTAANDTSGQNRARIVVVYGRVSSGTVSPHCQAMTFISGTIYNGPENELTSQTVEKSRIAADPVTNRFLAIFRDTSASKLGAMSFALSGGDTVTDKSSVVYPTNANADHPCIVYDTAAAKITIFFEDTSASSEATAMVCSDLTSSGLAFGSQFDVTSTQARPGRNGAVYDPNTKQIFIGYRDENNSDQGTGNMYTNDYSISNLTSTNFIGIADAAISDSASGSVTLKGGIATNTDITTPPVNSAGSKVVFDDGGPTTGISSVYDPDTAKVVNVFCTTTVQGIVGTVSGTSISYGSASSANSNSSSQAQVAYDTVNNKIVAVYKEGFNDARVVIGTVSGTTISWGTPVVFASVNAATPNVAFDTNAGKVLIVYKDQANNNYGKAVVGTVSGTSISIGSPVTFMNANANKIELVYDANAQKSVLVVQDTSNNIGVAYVATISGTSVSFGSPTNFLASAVTNNALSIVYNSTDNKVIVGYGKSSDNKGYLTTGTVSGTSISFAGETEFSGSTTTNFLSLAYKASGNILGMVYNIGGSTTIKFNSAVISGTSFSFGTEQELAAGATDTTAAVLDGASGNFVASYGDGSNNYDGTTNVASVSTSLVTNSTYYVQDDGTLSTTSSSVTAGKALSSTSINLEYNS